MIACIEVGENTFFDIYYKKPVAVLDKFKDEFYPNTRYAKQ
jgi:hypothetical protein